MGWKFNRSRRSIKILPGIRINTGKKGITSVTIGGGRKGIIQSSTNISRKGVRTTHSLRGVGSVSNYQKYNEAPKRTNSSSQNIGRSSSLRKSKNASLILCLTLGILGVHNFYLGHTSKGVLQLLTAGGCGIWMMIDLVLILLDQVNDADGNPLI